MHFQQATATRLWFGMLTAACPALLTLAFLLTSATARAGTDSKSYPATSCRQVQGSGGSAGTRPNGAIRNDSTGQSTTVICPIVRDNTQTTGSFTVSVRVDDRTSAGGVSCTAMARAITGAVASTSPTVQTGNMPIGLGNLILTVPSQSLEGYSAIKCTLPPLQVGEGSGLISYIVNEPDGGEGTSDQKSYTGTYAEILLPFVGLYPWIQYDDVGRAKMIHAAADDDWIMPLIRDSVNTWWSRGRLRFQDSDADLVLGCSIANYDEDGSVVGMISQAMQLLAGFATITVNQNPANPLYSGPMAMRCNDIQSDANVAMHDMRELIEGP